MTTLPVATLNARRTESYRGTALSCPVCRTELVALGATPDAENRAALEGPTCCVGREAS